MDNRTRIISNEDRLIEEIDKQAKVIQWYEKENRHNQEIIIKDVKEIEKLNNIIKHTDSWIDRTIEIIKQQPSEDDTWILERLNGIKQCLTGVDKSE